MSMLTSVERQLSGAAVERAAGFASDTATREVAAGKQALKPAPRYAADRALVEGSAARSEARVAVNYAIRTGRDDEAASLYAHQMMSDNLPFADAFKAVKDFNSIYRAFGKVPPGTPHGNASVTAHENMDHPIFQLWEAAKTPEQAIEVARYLKDAGPWEDVHMTLVWGGMKTLELSGFLKTVECEAALLCPNPVAPTLWERLKAPFTKTPYDQILTRYTSEYRGTDVTDAEKQLILASAERTGFGPALRKKVANFDAQIRKIEQRNAAYERTHPQDFT